MHTFWCRVHSERGKGCDADKRTAITRRVSSVSGYVSCAIHCDTQLPWKSADTSGLDRCTEGDDFVCGMFYKQNLRLMLDNCIYTSEYIYTFLVSYLLKLSDFL
jgi:hypothetical protein